MRCAVGAGQGQGAADRDRLRRLSGQRQRVAGDIRPAVAGLVVAGDRLQQLRGQRHDIGGSRAEHHRPPGGVDEHEPLDIRQRAHGVVFG